MKKIIMPKLEIDCGFVICEQCEYGKKRSRICNLFKTKRAKEDWSGEEYLRLSDCFEAGRRKNK